MTDWLLLHYKLPAKPSALRVYAWRKLKRLGAVLFRDAVWVLPNTPRNSERFRFLATEIVEMGGDVVVWNAQLALSGKDKILVKQFQDQADQAYRGILNQLGQPEADLEALTRQYKTTRQKDYFQSEVGRQVREALFSKRGVGS